MNLHQQRSAIDYFPKMKDIYNKKEGLNSNK